MKRTNRRLMAVCVIVCLLLSLAACGKSAASTAQGDSPDRNAQSTTGSDAAQTENKASGQMTENTEQGTTDTASTAQSSAQDGQDAASVYNGLFDDSIVHTIEVTIAEADWADLLENPLNKTKYETTVTIDGETLEQVSFSTKGNTSLSSVASDPDSNRYSFKLNFGKFNKGQTYYGLNKLSLNNLYADATCLKDWLSYRLFRQLGVDAPLTSFVWLRINGEDQGLCLAIEDVSESWLARTQDGEGVVYKPETESQAAAGGAAPNAPNHEQGAESAEAGAPKGGDFPGGMRFGGGANGADLQYSDDDPESYSDIFDNNETKLDEGAEDRLIAALKALSEGNAEAALDTDAVIRYFAAHNFVLNYDSYTGNMLHNYYLYENDGKLTLIPWDYNLAFGGFMGGGGMGGFPGGEGDRGGFPGKDGNGGFPGGNGGFPGGNGNDGGFPGANGNGGFPEENGNSEDPSGVDGVSGATPSTGDRTEPDSRPGNGGQDNSGDMPNAGDMPNPGENGNFGDMPNHGGMGGTDATSLINTGIDSPLSGTTADSRPMWAWIAADEAYLAQYHDALNELISSYFESGAFEEELDRMIALIRPYVEKDPTAFYSLDEFDTGVATLKRFCLLRAESIRKQLDGDLATQTDRQDAAARVEAADLNVQALGGMGGGKDRREGKR